MPLDIHQIRTQFPALKTGEVFFDNPGGTQVPQKVIDRMTDYLIHTNANHEGAFRTSIESDSMLHEAHAAMADFLNAASPDEIVFGANMTTLTFALSRAIGRTLQPGDEIVVTHLDHDGDIAPWLALEQDCGVRVRWVDVHPEDVTLDMADFEAQITERTKLVAVGYASNAVGTINDVKSVVNMAHAAGAQVFVDAVQYAPHGPMDVQALDCDYLACSAYKFFGPHVGVLYGKYQWLDSLPAYKVRPATNQPPGKFETGTQNHEGIAGTLGAIEYFEWLGQTFAGEYDEKYVGKYEGRRLTLKKAMAALRAYEIALGVKLIEGLESIPGLKIWGITDRLKLDRRVPTVSFTMESRTPRAIAEHLASRGIFVWDGNFYALAITTRLGLEENGGLVRVGLAHYNTEEEIGRLAEALREL